MEDKTITFKEGIPGFEEYKSYILLLNEDEENPFHKLQSTEDENISFLVVDPFLIKQDYDFKLKENTIESLKIESESDLAVFSIARIPEKVEDMTVNLAAPIIINSKVRLGKQVVLDNADYSVKHRVCQGAD